MRKALEFSFEKKKKEKVMMEKYMKDKEKRGVNKDELFCKLELKLQHHVDVNIYHNKLLS